jgi:ribosome-binding protein aMBF1 (putative translation factor)
VISAAHEKGLLPGDLDQQIGEALSEINSIEPEMDGSSERVQPLEIQGSWQLGYYAGKGKRLLADAGFDIAFARKAKKLTQAQLADAMGVDQAVISRWESGKVSPNAENLAKLKELLG